MGRRIHFCELCTQSFHHDNAAVIFLEIDGVLIRGDLSAVNHAIRDTCKKLFSDQSNSNEEPSLLEWHIAAAMHFDSSALENLHVLIRKIQRFRPVYIVLSSNWRHDGTLYEICDKIFYKHSFSEYIVGKLPPDETETWAPEMKAGHKYDLESLDQAAKIEFWLREHALTHAHFVILGGRNGSLPQEYKDRFVKISQMLLTQEHVNTALNILGINDKDIN